MTKLHFLTLIAAGLFAASAFAHDDKDCCAQTAGNSSMKGACEATFAKLGLTAGQKSKMEKLAAECDKTGCTKESMTKMEAGAKGILSKKQFATWKAACDGTTQEKSQS